MAETAEADTPAPAPMVCSIASPLAGKKLSKRLLKLTKKASKEKSLKRGVKEVVKALRKGEKGLVIIAADISPVDVITHVPILCEDQEVLYAWVPSRESLGSAAQTKRPTSVVLVSLKKESELNDTLKELQDEVKAITPRY